MNPAGITPSTSPHQGGAPSMKIDVWADVMCPWCYMGKRRLEEAVQAFTAASHPEKRSIEVEFHSFELAPELPSGQTQSVLDFNVANRGMSRDQAATRLEEVTERGRGLGLDLNFNTALLTNTSRAHQLIHYSKAHGKQLEAEEAVFAAYFTHGRNVSDLEQLGQIAEGIGLDGDDAVRALRAEEHLEAVRSDQAAASSYGIRSVPFFVIDGKYGLAGLQDASVMTDALDMAWSERAPHA
ncbi:DsbA family oxidoreductase [Arthrobacter frigidicola]|nr:DsbA family oxidoreductase [Arthrobacter frigidicola]